MITFDGFFEYMLKIAKDPIFKDVNEWKDFLKGSLIFNMEKENSNDYYELKIIELYG